VLNAVPPMVAGMQDRWPPVPVLESKPRAWRAMQTRLGFDKLDVNASTGP
jgi:hypothetical protein